MSTSGSIAARSSGWYISFIAAFYRRARGGFAADSRGGARGRRSRSESPAGASWRRDEDRRCEADGGRQCDRARQVAGDADRPRRQLEATKRERGEVGGAENPGAATHLPVEQAETHDPDLGQNDEQGEA